jgi:hypothetical protein
MRFLYQKKKYELVSFYKNNLTSSVYLIILFISVVHISILKTKIRSGTNVYLSIPLSVILLKLLLVYLYSGIQI